MSKINKKSMKECLIEAFKNNAIISSDGLDGDEFILVINGKAYYEDGGCLGSFLEAIEILKPWGYNYQWFVIRYLTNDEVKNIKLMKNKLIINSQYLRFKEELNDLLNLK